MLGSICASGLALVRPIARITGPVASISPLAYEVHDVQELMGPLGDEVDHVSEPPFHKLVVQSPAAAGTCTVQFQGIPTSSFHLGVMVHTGDATELDMLFTPAQQSGDCDLVRRAIEGAINARAGK